MAAPALVQQRNTKGGTSGNPPVVHAAGAAAIAAVPRPTVAPRLHLVKATQAPVATATGTTITVPYRASASQTLSSPVAAGRAAHQHGTASPQQTAPLCGATLRPPLAIQPVQCFPSPGPLLQAVRMLPLPAAPPMLTPPVLWQQQQQQQQQQQRPLPCAAVSPPEPPVNEQQSPVVDVDPWIEAARNFQMNTDFDWSQAVSGRKLDLRGLQAVMKEESDGKRTIQALGDKLMLHRLLNNLGVSQMPLILCVEDKPERAQIADFVYNHLCKPGSSDVIVKPTHLSNATGVIVLTRPKPEEVESAIDYIQAHINSFIEQKAGAHESVALRSLKPCFIGQPKYQSVVGFKCPLELRVLTLWGKARLAVWWWGRGAAPGEFPHRNVWFVRRLAAEGEFGEEDAWEPIHEHCGGNLGFDRSLELFDRCVHSAVATAESVATAVGSPFLRLDFFVGSTRWGLRLNEVAYGCGMEYRNRVDETGSIVDDAPSISRILLEGMAVCRRRLPPRHFLSVLGAKGSSYATMTVAPVSKARRRRRALRLLLRGGSDDEDSSPSEDDECFGDCEVPEELCRTLRQQSSSRELRQGRSRSLDGAVVPPLAGPAAAVAAALPAPAPMPAAAVAMVRRRMPAPWLRSYSLDFIPAKAMSPQAGHRPGGWWPCKQQPQPQNFHL